MPMIPPHNSLVRYDNPILVSSSKDGGVAAAAAGKGGKPGKKADQKTQLTPTEDILNSILPPREWTEEGQLWVQYVSSTPATRSDVIALQDHLDKKLQARQARETGICPIREELYAQCFDELIRQVTINCFERGLLLLRVRDEVRTAIASYQTLYESSIAFGMRKALQAEQHRVDMQNKIKQLEAEKRDLERQLKVYVAKVDDAEKKDTVRRQEEGAKHRAEIDQLRGGNEALKKELAAMLSIPIAASASAAAAAASKADDKSGGAGGSSAAAAAGAGKDGDGKAKTDGKAGGSSSSNSSSSSAAGAGAVKERERKNAFGGSDTAARKAPLGGAGGLGGANLSSITTKDDKKAQRGADARGGTSITVSTS